MDDFTEQQAANFASSVFETLEGIARETPGVARLYPLTLTALVRLIGEYIRITGDEVQVKIGTLPGTRAPDVAHPVHDRIIEFGKQHRMSISVNVTIATFGL